MALALGEAVIKAPVASSGRHRVRVSGDVDRRAQGWLAEQPGPLLVEPWREVVAELAVHGEIAADGTVRVLGVQRFGASGGAFRGIVLGPPDLGLPGEVRAFLHAQGRAPDRIVRGLTALAARIGADAAAAGLRGPFGVDARIVRVDGALRLVPVGDLNPRPTMGHLGRALRARLAGGATCGVWLFLPVRALGDPVAFAARARAANPVVVRGGRLASGAVATNDPATARSLLTLAWVAPTWRAAVDALGEVLPPGVAPLTGWIAPR
ncbi:MAG: hypothetical protein R3F59_16085 [Myxococcota bacterium]